MSRNATALPIPKAWLNEPKPKPVICADDKVCERWKQYKLPPCTGACARREFIKGVEKAK